MGSEGSPEPGKNGGSEGDFELGVVGRGSRDGTKDERSQGQELQMERELFECCKHQGREKDCLGRIGDISRSDGMQIRKWKM